MIWTRDLDDLSCTRARLRLPLDHPETTYLMFINCRCREFWNFGLGEGEGEELCLTKNAIERFRSRIKEINHKEMIKAMWRKSILAYVVMADGLVYREHVKHDDLHTS